MAASPTASASGSVAAAAAAASEASDGPVLCVVSKRLRALRKKQNRIVQMEERVASGKTLNREQEEVLRSKPVVAALIDELERLRAPLSSALTEELSTHPAPPAPAPSSSGSDSSIQDLLALVYFGSLFDVKPQSEFVTTMVARAHERSCCITYDYVGDDAADLLMENDLDAVAALAALAAARPAAAADVSHRDALQSCVHHARQWLSRANEPIHPDSPVTYAAVRAKLDRIMASDYYTAQAKITAPVDMAPASGSYVVGGVQAQDSMAVSQEAPVLEENLAAEGQKDELEDSKATEINTDHQSNTADGQKLDDESPVNPPEEYPSAEAQQEKFEGDVEEQDQRNAEPEDQQFITPRQFYPNQRGGGRGVGRRGFSNGRGGRGGRGMGGGGYQNGRGGGGGYGGYQGGGGGYQGGGGGYQNSRAGGGGGYYNNDSGYYQQRNNRARGGRSGGNSFYNNQGGGQQGGGAGRVELGANA